jgi:IMP cyclohydrolase
MNPDPRLSAILDNNNCFYYGHIPEEQGQLWEMINAPRYDYMLAVYDAEQFMSVVDAAHSEGVSDEFDCNVLASFGAALETPDKNFWNPDEALLLVGSVKSK